MPTPLDICIRDPIDENRGARGEANGRGTEKAGNKCD